MSPSAALAVSIVRWEGNPFRSTVAKVPEMGTARQTGKLRQTREGIWAWCSPNLAAREMFSAARTALSTSDKPWRAPLADGRWYFGVTSLQKNQSREGGTRLGDRMPKKPCKTVDADQVKPASCLILPPRQQARRPFCTGALKLARPTPRTRVSARIYMDGAYEQNSSSCRAASRHFRVLFAPV